MGRPIQKDVFGDTALPGLQFAITAKLPGEAVGEGYIVEQTGTSKYKVNINSVIGDVFLVNTLTPANLSDGEAFIAVTPFGGSNVAAYKIMQRRVNVWDTPDSASSTSSSYGWSGNPADAIGEADVGVSTAGGGGNILGDTSMLVFEQEDPQNAPTPYITTLRSFGWDNQNTPGNGQHTTFATSDNKIVMFHENDFTNGLVDGGAVTVLDGTTDPVPTVIGGSEITSTWKSFEIDEQRPQIIQLTDTRYARIGAEDTTGPTNSQRIEIIDVNLTTGAAAIDITHDLEQYYTVNRQAIGNNNIVIQKISSTRFAVIFTDSGVTTTSTVDGALFAMVFNDAGASITVQMTKTAMVDMTAPANNDGDSLADVGRMSAAYISNTNRILSSVFETTRNAVRDNIVVSCELNATFSGFDTTGAITVWLDGATYVSGFSPQITPIDDNHVILSDEDRRAGKDAPLLASIAEVNTSTLATTTGATQVLGIVGAGSLDNTRVDNDHTWVVDSSTKAYLSSGWESGDEEIAANTQAINQTAFDGTQDLDGNDRTVDTAANLTTAYPGVFSGTRVLAVDTGFVHRYNGATWDLLTLNSVRWDFRGHSIMEVNLDLGTNTITTSKQEMISSNVLPRVKSDGGGGVEFTGRHTTSETDSNNLVKLPNGKFVVSGEGRKAISTDGFATTEAEFSGLSPLLEGGDMFVQYFDPALMP